MTDAVSDALKAAQAAAAAQVSQAQTNLPATASAAGTAVGKPLTNDDLMTGSLIVDGWLKVSEHGIILDEERPVEFLEAEIDMSQVQVGFAIKSGNPPVYDKTYDKVTCATKPGSWVDVCALHSRIDPKSREYRMAELPIFVPEKDKTYGHTTSTTNWNNYASFYRALQKAGLERSVVKVKVGYEKRIKGSYKWGLLTFELLGAVT